MTGKLLKFSCRFPSSFPTGNLDLKISLLETNSRFPMDFPWISLAGNPMMLHGNELIFVHHICNDRATDQHNHQTIASNMHGSHT